MIIYQQYIKLGNCVLKFDIKREFVDYLSLPLHWFWSQSRFLLILYRNASKWFIMGRHFFLQIIFLSFSIWKIFANKLFKIPWEDICPTRILYDS